MVNSNKCFHKFPPRMSINMMPYNLSKNKHFAPNPKIPTLKTRMTQSVPISTRPINTTLVKRPVRKTQIKKPVTKKII